MQYFELPPPDRLRSVIRCFWFLRGNGAGTIQPVVPDGRAEIVLHLGDPFSIASPSGLTRQGEVLISGQLSGPIRLAPSAQADVAGIRFRTAAAGTALRLPMDTISDRVAGLADIRGVLHQELLSAAARSGDAGERTALLAEVLERRLSRDTDQLAHYAVACLERSGGGTTIGAIAQSAGVTMRTLERRIRFAVGLSPRLLQQVLRFRRAFHRLESGTRAARAAAESGYFDQAHLSREFRRFAGAPPGVFFRQSPGLAAALMSDPYKTAAARER